ncbi:NAD-dependent epimerase/dehydratase family protein [Pontibacter sp. Tf4]|uniref:NAD-dependent epimerase/dehydratase family protein n=1 Tax=Pontibacter sp. Tf4 TaxID=2761620 RepID=UPI001627BB4A|nr:NAD-dependent epimerase/dehydratase family protein [Pontibacter sp. Tf4]MBB6611564.1 NAD-dependent epimerase/dehydratase family protein [Pontibacter sp. Tf4]
MAEEQRILVTGSAGFIGHHLMQELRQTDHTVVGLDVLNSYYDPELKYARLEAQGFHREQIQPEVIAANYSFPNHSFIQLDLTNGKSLHDLFEKYRFDVVVNLAAQAGVRYSIDNPQAYIDSNLTGFLNLLECCRSFSVKHLLFASSSSVYGHCRQVPFKVGQCTDYPVSLYAATKKANEVLAYSYAHLYRIPTTGLRFFTVYGPWGRPDMAYYSFAKAITEDQPIQVFNNGDMQRDFTYVEDVVNCLAKLLRLPPETTFPGAPFKLYNIGNNKPAHLLELIAVLERQLGKKAVLQLEPMQPGDVYTTYADVRELEKKINYKPATTLETGLAHFVKWFKQYHYAPEVGVPEP